MFEGAGKYFLILFIFYLIVLLVVKVSLSSIFEESGVSKWKLFIPIFCRYVIIDKLDMKKNVFYMTLIPFVNLYFYNIVISRMNDVFGIKDNSILFILLPLYKFPELAFKNPEFRLNLYDSTEEFIHNEKSLFEQNDGTLESNNSIIIDPKMYDQSGSDQNPNVESVFSNSSLQPDDRMERYIEPQAPQQQEVVSPITVNNLRPKVCPNCGTKLEPTAKTCFFCGTNV